MDPVARMQRLQHRATADRRRAKRRTWNSLQRNCPELAERMGEFARLGVAGVACGGDVWGRVDAEDREWMEVTYDDAR